MKALVLLLLAGLAPASLANLHDPENEIPVKTQHTDATTQFISLNGPRKDHVSHEDHSKESSISKEERISEEKVEIKSTRPKSQKSMQPHPIVQEESFGSANLQPEETTEPDSRAATTSEAKMVKPSPKIKKNLDKIMKELLDNLKSLIPSRNDVMEP